MPINLEISLITQPTFRCGFPVKLYIWGTSTEITYEYVLSHNWALLLIGWRKFSATQKHLIMRKDWVMIWHQYGISAHIPWASFCRESPVLGSHVSMSDVSILRLYSSWIQSMQSKIDRGQYIYCCFPLQSSTVIWVQGDFDVPDLILSEVILGVAKDKQYLSAWVNFVICLFVCLFNWRVRLL